MPRSPFRALRMAAIGATILMLAAAAHVLGGGLLPAPLILAAIVALTALATTWITRYRISTPAMAALLGGSQLLLHQAFDALSMPVPLPGAPTAGGMAAMAGHWGHGAPGQLTDGPVQSLAFVTPVFLHDTGVHSPGVIAPAMFAAHAGATLLTGLVLARGERALWALADWLRPLRASSPAPFCLPPAPRLLRGTEPVLPAAPRRNAKSHSHRGPPRLRMTFD